MAETPMQRASRSGKRLIRLNFLRVYSAPLAILLLVSAVDSFAIGCTPQGEMPQQDRDSLLAAATPLANAVAAQNFDLLHAALLPAVVADWEGIRSAIQSAAPVLKGGQVQWRNAYLLDATDLKGPTDSQFFCTNPDNSLTVTINLRSLPAGKYAFLLGDFAGTSLAGQMAMILGNEAPGAGPALWKLGGLYVREGALNGHDGVWYWSQAREQAKKSQGWNAWFSYDTARLLLLPVDFVSSPNLEQLNREQLLLKSSPIDTLPFTVSSTPEAGQTSTRSWKVTGLRLDAALHFPDLAVTYEATASSDPVAARAEAVAVMSAFLKQHPELRESFHGLWAYANKDGKQAFAIELAMHDIP